MSFPALSIDGNVQIQLLDIQEFKSDDVFFHGTSWNLEENDYFTHLDPSYSDYDVIWLTDKENVAERFSKWHSDDKSILIVFIVKLKELLMLFDYEEDKLEAYGQIYSAKEFLDEILDSDDARDLYNHIREIKFPKYDGMFASGGISGDYYMDYAIFSTEKLSVTDFKYYDNNKKTWSNYFPISMVDDEFIQKLMEKLS